MVPVVARAWNADARQPAARVRLNAIAASTSQASWTGMTLRKVGERTVLEVGVDLLDDRVGAVGLLGLDEDQRGNLLRERRRSEGVPS